jgi:hypothetical protein
MEHRTYHRWLSGMALVFFLLLPVSTIHPAEAALTLTIQPSDGKSEVLHLLPVVLTLELKNESDTTQSLPGAGLHVAEVSLGEYPPRYRFYITKPDGTQGVAYLSDWVGWNPDGSRIRIRVGFLRPGHRQILDYCLAYGADRLPPSPEETRISTLHKAIAFFPTTGTYEVQLRMITRQGEERRSNMLPIAIKLPESATDVLAHTVLSHGEWPQMLLAPLSPLSDIHGLKVFYGDPIGERWYDEKGKRRALHRTTPVKICREILSRCPDSAYAPYARVFLGTALSRGWAEDPETTFPKTMAEMDQYRLARITINVEKRAEGIRLLRQAAEDPKLPRRYREEALLSLPFPTKELCWHIKESAKKKLPLLENILGGAKVDLRLLPLDDVYGIAYQLTTETKEKIFFRSYFEKVFTPEQVETLKAAAKGNPDFAAAGGVSPLQIELQEHTKWARAELRKIPWRDPETGELTMAPIPPSPAQ